MTDLPQSSKKGSPKDPGSDGPSEDKRTKAQSIPDTYIPDDVPETADGVPTMLEPDTQDVPLEGDQADNSPVDGGCDSDAFEDDDDDDMWDFHETQIDKAVAARETRAEVGMPDRQDLFAMEEPLYRLMGAAVLFYDHATALAGADEDARTIGLIFLSQAMKREADRLFRLYHGHQAQGS